MLLCVAGLFKATLLEPVIKLGGVQLQSQILLMFPLLFYVIFYAGITEVCYMHTY